MLPALFLVYSALGLTGASVVSTRFVTQDMRATWVPADGQLVGKLDAVRCAARCAQLQCFAFHVTAAGDCYFALKAKNWKEQPQRIVRFSLRTGAEAAGCHSAAFPLSFGRSRYFFDGTQTKTWFAAADFCESRGGKLVQISSAAELHFLWSVINSPVANSRAVYVGGHRDGGSPSEFKWHGSGEAFNASYWDSANSQPGTTQYAAGFWHTSALLHDLDHRKLEKFLCECLML